MKYTDRLRRLLKMHHTLYRMLYPGAAKPKFHHLLHIVDNMLFIGRLLSCFVTERKHREAKKSALHVFRCMEHTVLVDMINRQCEHIVSDANLFIKSFLVNPKRVTTDGITLFRSLKAILHCGEIRNEDIVWLESGVVGKVVCFWQTMHASEFSVQLETYARSDAADDTLFSDAHAIADFADATTIIDACIWAHKSAGVMRVLKPFGARVSS